MGRTEFTRRSLLGTFARASLGLGITSALAACAAPQGTVAPTAAPAATQAAEPTSAPTQAAQAQEIEAWNANWGEEWNPLIRAAGDKFQEATGTKVSWLFNDDWQEKLLTAVAAGNPPDCAYTNYVGLPTLAFSGTLLAMDDYFAASSVKREDFIKAMMDACVYEGKSYGMPVGADFIALIYNRDLYSDVGLDPEAPPRTLDEWVAHSEQIYQLDDAGNPTRIGMHPTGAGLTHHGFGFGGELYDSVARRVTCNEDGVVEALEWEVENAKRWDIEKVAAFSSSLPGYSQPNSGIATGKEAYLVTGPWAADSFNKYAPDLNYGVAFLPTPGGTDEERKTYVVQGYDYSIPTGASNPDGAWEFIKYAWYDNAWEMAVKSWSGNCVLAQMERFEQGVTDLLGADDRMVPYLKVFNQTGAAGEKYWPVMPVASRYSDEFYRAEESATRQQKSAQVALDDCAEIVQAELDKVMAG